MAQESTTTSLNDIVYSAWIELAWLGYAMDWIVAQQFFRRFSLIGRPSATAQIPRLDSNMGSVGDTGQGVDSEFDATEGTDLANTQATTSNIQCTVSEYALMRTITDNVEEDSVNGLDAIDRLLIDAARILMTAFEDDCVGLFGSLANSVGTTTADLTVAQALAAQVGIRTRGHPAPDGVVYVLDDQQNFDLEAALTNVGTNQAAYTMAVDRLLGVDRTANNGMGNGHTMFFRGYPVYSTGLTDTANSGADVVGACLVPSSPANDSQATFAQVDKRPFRVEPQRDASLRASELVFSMRKGASEATDGSGTNITTDA